MLGFISEEIPGSSAMFAYLNFWVVLHKLSTDILQDPLAQVIGIVHVCIPLPVALGRVGVGSSRGRVRHA